MARHLTESDARLALRQGRAIEQFLGARHDEGDRLLRWVRCHTEPSGARVVSVFEVYDEGRPDFSDPIEFAAVDPDEPYGTSRSFETPEEAWSHLVNEVGAAPEKFVGSGMAADEYRRFVAIEGWWPAA